MKDNFFIDVQKIRSIDTHRILYFVLAVLSFILTELGRYVYRPYIYANEINDYGFADSMGNLGGIIVQIFFSLSVLNSSWPKNIRLIIFLVSGYILYEVLQPYLPKGTFDWLDVYGTVLGGAISATILFVIKVIPLKNRTFFRL